MKQYVWMTVTLAVITGVNASENPFDPAQNLSKLEQEQQALLKDIKKEAVALKTLQEASEDANIDAEDEENTVEAAHTMRPAEKDVQREVPQEKRVVDTTVSKEDAEKANTVSADKSPTATPKEMVKIEEVKADQAKIDAEREAQVKARAETEAKKRAAEEKAKQEREALAKLKAEREAAQKREQEMELAKQKAEKERLEKQSAEKITMAKVSEGTENTVASDDINITKEELEAKRKADEELKKAIAEVDQED